MEHTNPSPVKGRSKITKATAGKKAKRVKAKDLYAFESKEKARRFVIPVLREVGKLMKHTWVPFHVPGSLNRLSNWLMRMERGNRHDARTPLFASRSYSQIEKVMNYMTKVNDQVREYYSGIPSFPDNLAKVEVHQAEKIGPRGVYPPAHEWLDEKVSNIWKDKPPLPNLNRAAIERALEWLRSLVPAHSIDIEPGDLEKVTMNSGTEAATARDLNVSTNSCFPSWVKGFFHKVWDKSVDLVHRMAQRQLQIRVKAIWDLVFKVDSYKQLLPRLHFVCTASQRTNVSDGHVPKDDGSNVYKGVIVSKLRAVCAQEKTETWLGKVILNKVMDACIEHIRNPDGTRVFTALTSPDRIDKNMEICLQTAHKNGYKVLSTDYSNYDATVPPWLAWEVAKAVSNWMTSRCANLFLALIYADFYQSKCITTTKVFPEGPSSVKSGMIWTNIMDSLVNLTVQRYGLEAGHFKSILSQFVQGDDGILGGEGCEPEPFEQSCSEIGLVANASKQYFEEDSLSFCQKIYVRGYPGGIYPISRACAAVVSLEDDVTIETDKGAHDQFPWVLAYRTRCRINTACFNPNFVKFTKVVAADDRPVPAANYPGKLGSGVSSAFLAKKAGSYATKFEHDKLDKPWRKAVAPSSSGFGSLPVNRVLEGELPPPPGKGLFKWVYGVDFDTVSL